MSVSLQKAAMLRRQEGGEEGEGKRSTLQYKLIVCIFQAPASVSIAPIIAPSLESRRFQDHPKWKGTGWKCLRQRKIAPNWPRHRSGNFASAAIVTANWRSWPRTLPQNVAAATDYILGWYQNGFRVLILCFVLFRKKKNKELINWIHALCQQHRVRCRREVAQFDYVCRHRIRWIRK